jgi:hypothetical protein
MTNTTTAPTEAASLRVVRLAPTSNPKGMTQTQILRAQRILTVLREFDSARVLDEQLAAEYLDRFDLVRHSHTRLSMAGLAVVLVKAGHNVQSVRDVLVEGLAS